MHVLSWTLWNSVVGRKLVMPLWLLYTPVKVSFGYGLECRSNLQQAGGHDMK